MGDAARMPLSAGVALIFVPRRNTRFRLAAPASHTRFFAARHLSAFLDDALFVNPLVHRAASRARSLAAGPRHTHLNTGGPRAAARLVAPERRRIQGAVGRGACRDGAQAVVPQEPVRRREQGAALRRSQKPPRRPPLAARRNPTPPSPPSRRARRSALPRAPRRPALLPAARSRASLAPPCA